jgi:hypothetical protein
MGEWPIVIGVLKRLQTEHARKKNQCKHVDKKLWWVQELTCSKQFVHLSVNKMAEANADSIKPSCLKLFSCHYYNKLYGTPFTCTFNRPYASFDGRQVNVAERGFGKGSPAVYVGPNNCFVAKAYLSKNSKIILRGRARHVDAEDLIQQGDLLSWRWDNRLPEAPESDGEVLQPPQTKKRRMQQAPASDDEALPLGRKPKKRQQARSSDDAMPDSPNEIDGPEVAAAKKALADTYAAQKRRHAEKKHYVCIPAKASL